MKKPYPIITSLIAATVILTGCTTGSDGSSTTTTTVSKSSESQEKITSAAQRNNLIRAMELSSPSDKKYVLSIPFETDENDEHYDEQFSINLAFKTDDLNLEDVTSQEEKSSKKTKKTKKEDNYVYASMSGTNEHFKDIMKAFEPIITDNESTTRSFKTQRGQTYITWEINQEDYPEVAEQVDNIFREYYTELNDKFNRQVGQTAQNALKHFDEKN